MEDSTESDVVRVAGVQQKDELQLSVGRCGICVFISCRRLFKDCEEFAEFAVTPVNAAVVVVVVIVEEVAEEAEEVTIDRAVVAGKCSGSDGGFELSSDC